MIRFSLLYFSLLFLLHPESSAAVIQSDSIKLIHSGKVIEEGLALQNEGKYAMAIEKYLSVPQSDTNYIWMQSELIVSYLENKEFDKAIEVGERNLKERSDYTARFYVALANAYSSNEKTDEAIALYEKGLKLYPYDYLLHYNLGVALVKKKAHQQAIDHFQRAIQINPFYANSHLYLGNMMIMQGRKSRAMMCLGVYLTINPSNNGVLVLLNSLLQNTLEYENSHPAEEKAAAFYELDLLIKSNAALDKKFKSEVAFKAPVAQQLELMLESIPAEEKGNDFWMQFYVPLYKNIQQKGLKATFVYHLLSSVDDKGVARWLKSNKKNVDKFYALANEQFKAFRAQQPATLRGEKGLYAHWFYDNNRFNAIGNQKDENTYIGPWEFYYPNGQLKAEGNFTNEGKKIGKWQYYYANGAIKKKEEYDSNGKVQGVVVNYYEKGGLQNEVPYKADLIEGQVKIYYPCGQLKEVLQYKEDKRHGEGTTYYLSGQIHSRYTYKDNEPEGAFTYFYKNGKKKEVYTYSGGKLNGEYLFYHQNGQLSQQGAYLNGELSGDWFGFYENGTKSFKGTYSADVKTGTWYNYHEDGSLQSEELYDQKGALHGKSVYYTKTGQLYYEHDYKAGMLVGYKFYDKDKKVLSEGADAKGNFKIRAYYPEGALKYEGVYKKGKGNGMYTYYYPSGVKSSVVHYKDDVYDGPYDTYYESGQKNISSTYVNGVMHGYYRQYHKNGKLRTEGWLTNGEMEQTWVSYFPDGKLSHRQYYLFGKKHGTYEQLDALGRPYVKSEYYHGLNTHEVQFDTLGAPLKAEKLEMGNGKNTLYYASKKVRFEVPMSCGEYTADLKSYYKNGKLYAITPLKNGEFNGRYKAFYDNQKVRTEGDYVDGEQTGMWTWYFENGKLDAKIPLKNGKAEGERLDYYEGGEVRTRLNYKNDLKIGSNKYYAPDGSLQIEKIYDEHGLVQYRYLDKNNTLTPFIALKNYDGPVKAYYPNGNVSVEQHYKKSLLDGKQITYYPSGKIMEIRFIKEGIDEGVREEYYPDGKVKKTSPYVADELHGQVVEYYANGKAKKKTSYLYGDKEGWELSYDESGKLLRKEYYRDGYVY